MSNNRQAEMDQLPKIDQFIKNFAQLFLFMYDFDALAIYKGTYTNNRQTRYRFYLRPELRLDSNNFDKYRRRFRYVAVFIYSVIALRFSLASLVQMAKYQATTFESLDGRSGGDKYNHPVIRETELIKMLKRYYVYDIFGNILSDFPAIALAMHIALLVSISYTIYYMPLKFRMKPTDSIDLRMALIPQHERKRIDLQLNENVERLILDMESFHRESAIKTIYKYRNSEFIQSTRFDQWLWQQPQQTTDTHLKQIIDSVPLRPLQYSSGCTRYWRRCRYLLPLISVPIISFVYMTHMTVIGRTLRFRCKLKEIKANNCNFANAFEYAEIYSNCELIVSTCWLHSILGSLFLAILLHMDSQLSSIREWHQELHNLLATLRHNNGSHSPDDSDFMGGEFQADIKEYKLDDILLSALAKTNFQLTELRSRTVFISELVSPPFVLFVTGIVLTLVAVKMDGPHIQTLRNSILASLWWALNCTMAICAYQYARIIKLQKICLSIAAQLAHRLARMVDDEIALSRTRLDPLTRGWLQFIVQDCLVDIRNSVRPFGISLTFGRIIEVNFYVTSLAVLVFR